MNHHEPEGTTMLCAYTPTRGSALDPRVEEVRWQAWRLLSASSKRLTSQAHIDRAAGLFDRLCEDLWLAGRISLITQIETDADGQLRIDFGVGIFGSAGATADEMAAATSHIEMRLTGPGLPFSIEPTDPEVLLDQEEDQLAYAALIRQRHHTLSLADGKELRVLSRFNPPADPWSPVARLLQQRTAATKVRATVLPAELPVSAKLELESAMSLVSEMDRDRDGRADGRAQLERAARTLVDLQSSFATPVMCAEIAVSSCAPLPEVFLRTVATSFTSEHDVQRRDGHLQVAGQHRLLGGFELDRDVSGLHAAHRAGLPLHGGHEPAALRDLVTFYECPLGWPLPIGGPIPTLPSTTVDMLPVPAGFDQGVRIGVGPHRKVVHLPTNALDRHLLSVGAPGTGKTTVLVAVATAKLLAGQGFAYLDPHGQAATRLRTLARANGQKVAVIDPATPHTMQIELVPRLELDGSNLEEVEQAAADLAEAIASTLSDPDFAGPIWQRNVRALIVAAATHGVELADAMLWIDDDDTLDAATEHPMLPGWARSALRNVLRTSGSEGARLRDYLVSKLSPFMSGNVRRILAAPGRGTDADTLLRNSVPLIVDLSQLARSDAALIGNLMIASLLRAAFARTDAPEHHYALLVDEAHRYHAASMDRVNAEGRKFALSLALATQSLRQLAPGLRDAMSGAALTIAFRQTPDSAARLAPLIDVPPTNLTDLPDLHAYVHLAGGGTCTARIDPYTDLPPACDLPTEEFLEAATPQCDAPPVEPTRSHEDAPLREPTPGPDSFYAGWVARRLGG